MSGKVAVAAVVVVLLLLGAALSVGQGRAARLSSPAGAQRVLFVGNSLTTAHGMPTMVSAVAAAVGAGRVETATVAFGNFSLGDHWAQGDARRAISRGGWSVVVLQQGPSALPESRDHLRDYTRRFHGVIAAAGARTALYMVWPSRARSGDFDAVHESYRLAATDVGGLFLPAGAAWRAAWARDPALPLYGADGFHPTPLGSYLAALVIVRQIAGAPLAGVPRRLHPRADEFPRIDLTAAQMKILHDAVAAATSD